MKKILKVFLIVGFLLAMIILVPIVYYLVDIKYSWLHEYQTIELDYEKRVQIYNNNLDDATSFYLTIKKNHIFPIKEEFLWITFDLPSFSIIHSPSYEVIGITKYGSRPNEVIALFDFETNEFWAADNDKHNDQELGRKLLTKLLSYLQEPFVLYGSEK